jgi:proteasome lid subunit RPN8/RPN11
MQLERNFYEQMVQQGLAEFPNECCGLIAGSDGRAVKVFPMVNADASPVTYRLEPRQQLKVQDEMDEAGWDLMAIYHSHTHSEAYPSETDRKQAFYPDSYYLVLSLSDRENPVLRAFRIVDGEISEEELEIV